MKNPLRESARILVVDDDTTVRQVLGRVLKREGYTVLEAGDPTEALQLAAEHAPQLALLDLCLPGGDGVDLAERLHATHPNLPLVLITAYPLRLREDPGLARRFLRVLTKPIDVNEFRLAVNAALSEGAMQSTNPSPVSAPDPIVPAAPPKSQTVAPPAHAAAAAANVHAHHTMGERIRSTVVVVAALFVLAGFIIYVAGVPLPGLSAAEGSQTIQKAAPLKIEVLSHKGEPLTVLVPEDVRAALGIRTKSGVERLATARQPAEAWPLVLSGSTALDPSHLMRIRARFAPAEVVEIGKVDDLSGGATTKRELRSGDHVRKGDLLGIFYSVDVGNKKNDLVDAHVQLKLDQEILAGSQRAYDKGAIPMLDLLAAKKAVENDYNAIGRAENTLRAWTVPEEDIEAVRKEAEEINRRGGQRDRDPKTVKEQLRRWARVELRAPDDGTIVERNVNEHEVVVDPTINLFQVAQVDRLLVVANAPEDKVAALKALPTNQWRWVVHTAGAPAAGILGAFYDIGYVNDVSQHNAVVKGYIPNTEGVLRSGQYMTATVRLPPPEDVVEISTNALADDGKQAVVFVQADDKKPGMYTMRRVEVVQRMDRSVFVRSRFPDGKDEQPLTPQDRDDELLPLHVLKPDERVITAGVLEIKKELEDRPPVEAEAARK